MDMTLFEVDEAANRIRDEVDSDANIIFGSTFDENMEGRMRVSVVATGIEAETGLQRRPVFNANNNAFAQGGSPVGHNIQQPEKKQVNAPQPTHQAYTDGPAKTLTPTRGTDHSVSGGNERGFNGGDMSIPASIIPQTANPATSHGPMMSAGNSQPESSNAGFEYGQASTVSTTTAATSAAVKLDEQADTAATHTTKPMSFSQPVRGQRHGNTFIPPKPFTAEDEDLFDAADMSGGVSAQEKSALTVTEPTGPAAPTRGAVQEKPGFFERLTGHRRHDIPTAPKREDGDVETNMSVTEGGKAGSDDDELDIPAFLRRQAN